MSSSKSLREAYGEALQQIGEINDKVIVMDADLSHATMTCMFQNKYPERFYNFGIAESNMICAAAGFAHSGFIPFVSTFSLFGTGRSYEQIRNSICYVNANVKLAFTHAGISVGEDGGSHQTIEDIALMRVLPNMTILVPCDPLETQRAVKAAVAIDGSVYIRIGRPVCEYITNEKTPFIVGKANILSKGENIAILATGLMVHEALKAKKKLEKENINITVANFHTIKPLDTDLILKLLKNHHTIISVEEHSIIGGLGSAIAEVLAEANSGKLIRIGINDKFGKSGKPEDLFKEYGLTSKDIVRVCKQALR